MNPRHRQRGVALIMAVLIVALAVILATQIGFDSAVEQRRSSTVLSLDQGFLAGVGAEAWAAKYLRDDIRDGSKVDHLGEEWATPIPPIEVEGGQIEGRIEDLQGRFNINNLVRQNGNQFVKNEVTYAWFKRLLELLDLEPKWADAVLDWLDSDDMASGADGAEDDVYTSQQPPYRTGNGPIVSVSELLALPQFGAERYRKLRPYISALPIGATINVCTAPGAVLDSMLPVEEYSRRNAEELAREREGKCFPEASVFKALAIGPQTPEPVKTEIERTVKETTDYFRATILITIGTTEFTLYSLLHRESSGLVRPVMRSFGTD